MTLTKTPICNFGDKAKNFTLLSTENKKISLNDITGENGTLIMFICNHCPYVKAVIKDIVEDVKFLTGLGIKSAAIMSNDVKNYPDDSFENMISFSKLHGFTFPHRGSNADSKGITAPNHRDTTRPCSVIFPPEKPLSGFIPQYAHTSPKAPDTTITEH